MENKVFLFKTIDENDRDCVKYLDISNRNRVSTCNGACYGGFDEEYVYIKHTILTKEEFNKIKYNELNSDELEAIITKLQSVENEKIFEVVQQEESEFLQEEFNLSEEEVEEIFENYPYSYRDRSVVSCIYGDCEELAQEDIEGGCFGEVADYLLPFIDLERLGETIISNGEYYVLDDDRVVCYYV